MPRPVPRTVTPLPRRTELDAAWQIVREHLEPTPIMPLADGVFGKAEYALPTGAFKVRGALAALAALRDAGADEVIAASAGNHGQGVAWAAQRLNVRATVVVPRDCPPIKLDAMRARCDVLVHDQPGYDAAEQRARAMASERGLPFVSPFDDPHVMAGNGGTLARELLTQIPDVATVVVPVGGGGLLCGIVAALDDVGHDAAIVPVQSVASPAFATSVRDGVWHDTWPPAPTLAEGLEGGAGAASVAVALDRGLAPRLVDEDAIARAIVALHARLGRGIEGSGAVGYAALAAGLLDALPRPVAIVLTGGNIADATIAELRSRHP